MISVVMARDNEGLRQGMQSRDGKKGIKTRYIEEVESLGLLIIWKCR